MDTKEKLDRLSEMQSQVDVIRLHFDGLKAQILTPEIQSELYDIDAEMGTALEALQGGINSLNAEIKEDVINGSETIKGNFLMAVFNKGRESVDMKQLKGYAVAHPEVNAMIKTGDPSVTIRKI